MPRSSAVAALVATAALLAGCTDDPPDGEQPAAPDSVALRVTTAPGAGDLDEDDRTRLETAVGDVLSQYVVDAFLGDFPRDDFVRSFDEFTSGAAETATADIDVLTAARVADATDVRATRLDARLSFLTPTPAGDAIGATAAVQFEFEATMPDGGTQNVSLRGRLMLQPQSQSQSQAWVVFGYDVAGDDGAAQSTEPS